MPLLPAIDARTVQCARADDHVGAGREVRLELVEFLDRTLVIGVHEPDDVTAGEREGLAYTSALAAALILTGHLDSGIARRHGIGQFTRTIAAVHRHDDFERVRL